jgi:hypothetical protein
MHHLTINDVLQALFQHISSTLALQITDPQHADYGGIIYPEWGLASPSHGSTAPFIVGCGFLYLDHAGPRRHHTLELDPADLLCRATRAADYMLHFRFASGTGLRLRQVIDKPA